MRRALRVLAVEPFYGGSHRAHLDGWREHSSHTFVPLTLPPYKWKWRMRHASVTFAEQLGERTDGASFDALWASDMLNLAEFLGLAPIWVQRLPGVAYFHENQLTYPVREAAARDLHFAYSNFTTCLAAQQVWFNSAYHRDAFTSALSAWLTRMPDYQSIERVDEILARSVVAPPGVGAFPQRAARSAGPLRIGWNARWEHDKNPDDFFAAMRELKRREIAFQLIVLGESFRSSPQVFATSATRIRRGNRALGLC